MAVGSKKQSRWFRRGKQNKGIWTLQKPPLFRKALVTLRLSKGQLPLKLWSSTLGQVSIRKFKITQPVSDASHQPSVHEQKTLELPLTLREWVPDDRDRAEVVEMKRKTRKAFKQLNDLSLKTTVQVLNVHSGKLENSQPNCITYYDLVDAAQVKQVMTFLKESTNLRTLIFNLRSNKIDREVLQRLEKLQHLQVTPYTVPQLLDLPTLKTLTIVNGRYENNYGDNYKSPFKPEPQPAFSQAWAEVNALFGKQFHMYAIQCLPNLTHLQILDQNLPSRTVKQPLIDFSSLPRLKALYICGAQVEPRKYTLHTLGNPLSLETLHLVYLRPELRLFEVAQKLRHLVLEEVPLDDVNMILSLKNLETLELIKCNFRSLDLRSCPRLRHVAMVHDDRPNLQPLQGLDSQLETLFVSTKSRSPIDAILPGLSTINRSQKFRCMIKTPDYCHLPQDHSLETALETFDKKKQFLQTRLTGLDNRVGDPRHVITDQDKTFMPRLDMY